MSVSETGCPRTTTGVNDAGGAVSPPRGRRARSSPASARTSSKRSSGRSCRSHRSRVSRNCCCSAWDNLSPSASPCSRLLVPISDSLSCPAYGLVCVYLGYPSLRKDTWEPLGLQRPLGLGDDVRGQPACEDAHNPP